MHENNSDMDRLNDMCIQGLVWSNKFSKWDHMIVLMAFVSEAGDNSRNEGESQNINNENERKGKGCILVYTFWRTW